MPTIEELKIRQRNRCLIVFCAKKLNILTEEIPIYSGACSFTDLQEILKINFKFL